MQQKIKVDNQEVQNMQIVLPLIQSPTSGPEMQAMIGVHLGSNTVLSIPLVNIRRILTMYRKEKLLERKFFRTLVSEKNIRLRDLKEEAYLCFINWRIFLLDTRNLKKYLKQLKRRRNQKMLSRRLVTNRENPRSKTNGLSPRLVDRLIDIQDYCKQDFPEPNALINKYQDEDIEPQELAERLLARLGIDRQSIRTQRNKENTLKYLTQKVESQQIGVARFRIYRSIVPTIKEIRATYRGSSGFILHDNKLPYISLPYQEKKDDQIEESFGRQIYTLLFLLVALALGKSNVEIGYEFEEFDHEFKHDENAFIHETVGKMMLPSPETNHLVKGLVTSDYVLALSTECKLTPKAVLVILQKRNKAPKDYVLERSEPINNSKKEMRRSPRISTAISNFYGESMAKIIMSHAISQDPGNRLAAPKAQYLLFGRIKKELWRELKREWEKKHGN